MATPGFGFSVGDFIAGVSLVKKLVRALNDSAGSCAAYRKLISELLNLEDALTEITKLQLGEAQESQKLILHRVGTQCLSSIETFISKNAKFKDSLGPQPSTTPASWRANLHKIQWALCKDNAIDGLRTEIAHHTAALNVTLATVQVSTSKLNEQCLDNCTQQLRVVCDQTKEANSRIVQTQQTLVAHIGWMETMARTFAEFVSGQQENGLLSLAYKAIQWNARIFDAVNQMQQLLGNIPPQVGREQPVLFEDAHGRLAPFHVEFINSYAAFQAVLEARFENMPGLRKVRNLEYAMQDVQSKKILDFSTPWENNFRPGRRFNMSMVFQLPKAVTSSCPGCSTKTYNRLMDEGLDIQCDNPDCGMFYRRITDVDNSKPAKRKRSDSYSNPGKRMKHGLEKSGTEEDAQDGQDGINEFRRVQIIHQELGGVTEQPTSHSDRRRCIKNTYRVIYDDGKSDIVQSHECPIGHISNDPIVRDHEHRFSTPSLHTDDTYPSVPSLTVIQATPAVRSPSPESSDEYCPGWTPEAEFDWGVQLIEE